MIAQFLEVKRAHPDCLLFYRMGDFYELFFEDAVKAAEALDITLTKRGRHNGEDFPLCGVPVHAADGYLARLIRKGFRVAVCEQVEDPAEARKRRGKTLVKRDVVRVVTPGTLSEDTLLDARQHNYLAALAEAGGALGLAWLDMSTGEFCVEEAEESGLGAALARVEPGEIILSERVLGRPEFYELFGDWKAALTPLPTSRFDSENARRRLEALYGVKALDAFGAFGRAELAAAGALVDYLELTQKGRMPRLAPPRHMARGAAMESDAATRRNLELTRNLSGDRRGSLLSVIDRTVTGGGARLLAAHLAAPLTEPAKIARRLDMVAFFTEYERPRADLRHALKRCPDIERALSRLALGRGGPRDLAAIGAGLERAGDITSALAAAAGKANASGGPPEGIAARARDLGEHGSLIGRLARALDPEPPLLARDGGFVAKGYAPALDEQRTLRDESRRLVANLEARARAETGIASLKIRHNNVLGYFVEVGAVHADKLMTTGGPYIHRQTMANAGRFTTVELSELEERIGRAADKALALELELFADLVGEVTARAEPIALAAASLAALDVALGLAELAIERRYVRPRVDDSLAFDVAGGRHPVVESTQDEPFIGNDCDLDRARRLWLVTGPNMAGKSTFLRQNALIAILAQMGSFVPAESAHIGIVDRLFSRVGAADDLARGRSTFMVEMVETAVILNQAGERALVILDEIGRGTATFDGLSIAWATVEHLHGENRCRALFATHYHELTSLTETLAALSCHVMRVKEWRGEVIFLHEVAPGAADRSYGIHVARLAGLPGAVVARAEQVLETLEAGEQSGGLSRLVDDLPLFTAAPPATAASSEPSPAAAALAEINPDELTPKAALELLYRLKALAGE
ncbi:MAG: DNA mismatch repair protein MutS [Alphaproteobacteria bacterium]